MAAAAPALPRNSLRDSGLLTGSSLSKARRFVQQGLTMLPIAKRLGATGASRGERGYCVAIIKEALKIGGENEFIQEAGIKTVAGADGIHRLNRQGRRMKLIFAASGNCAVQAALDHNNRNDARAAAHKGTVRS